MGRGGCHHSQQETEEQDRRMHHSSHEENRGWTGPRYLREAAGGGTRTSRQLRAGDLRSGTRSDRGGCGHEGDVEDLGFQWIESSSDATPYPADQLQQVMFCWVVVDPLICRLNTTL